MQKMWDNNSLTWKTWINNQVWNILSNDKNLITIAWDDNKWMEFINQKLNNNSLSEREKAYFSRVLRVLAYKDLSKYEWHPVNLVINKISNSDFFEWFDNLQIPQIVAEWETFDLFNFPENHVARRPSDSYFIQKSENKKESILLRPHTSVMWYHYLINW